MKYLETTYIAYEGLIVYEGKKKVCHEAIEKTVQKMENTEYDEESRLQS